MPITPICAVHLATTTGELLPDPIPLLALQWGVKYRRGQLSMVAGPPGAGKTFLAQNMVYKMGVPTLYISADSSPVTMMMRHASLLSGDSSLIVSQARDSGVFESVYGSKLRESNILYSFESAPSMSDIVREAKGYNELTGEYPHVLVLDNLMNAVGDSDSEWAALRQMMQDLHYVARDIEAHIMILHHISEATNPGNPRPPGQPAPRYLIQGKINQLPEIQLSVATDGKRIGIAVVKNRDGESDMYASRASYFDIDISTMRFDNQ